jgi:flavin-binding protein dodecin
MRFYRWIARAPVCMSVASYGNAMTSISKTIRLKGEATESIEAAIDAALARAGLSISSIQGFEVVAVGGRVGDDGSALSYRATVDVTFDVLDVPGHAW